MEPKPKENKATGVDPAAWPTWVIRSLSGFVGLFLISAGLIKGTDMALFIRQMAAYGIISQRVLVVPAAWMLIAAELALGTGLILHYRPRLMLPLTTMLLTMFFLVTGWGWFLDLTDECGCFGVLFDYTPGEAMLMDLGLIVMTLLAWKGIREKEVGGFRFRAVAVWGSLLVGLVFPLIFGFEVSGIKEPASKTPRVRLDQVHVMGLDRIDLKSGSQLIVLMDTDCHTCREKIPALNRLSGVDDLPDIIGLFKNDEEKVREFYEEFQPHFPVGRISEDDFWKLLGYGDIPRTLLIRDGQVIKAWDLEIPTEVSIEKGSGG